MSPNDSLQSKLKKADPEIREYVSALQKENAKLHKRIAKLETDNLTANHWIRALEQEVKKLHKTSPTNYYGCLYANNCAGSSFRLF